MQEDLTLETKSTEHFKTNSVLSFDLDVFYLLDKGHSSKVLLETSGFFTDLNQLFTRYTDGPTELGKD